MDRGVSVMVGGGEEVEEEVVGGSRTRGASSLQTERAKGSA